MSSGHNWPGVLIGLLPFVPGMPFPGAGGAASHGPWSLVPPVACRQVTVSDAPAVL